MSVQLELLRVGPDIGAVVGHIDGQIPDDGDAVAVGKFLQPSPLAEKQILDTFPEVNLFLQQRAGAPQGLRPAKLQGLGPLMPGNTAVVVLQGHEQGVVLQPVGLGLA